MKTEILKERDLQNEGMRVGMKLHCWSVRVAELDEKIAKMQARREKAEHTRWQLSENLAGIKGLISSCKDGSVEVVTSI